MAQASGKFKLRVVVGDKEIDLDITDFEVVPTLNREECQELTLRMDYESNGRTGSLEVNNVNSEAYEPLGIIDHFTWGPLLN